MKTVSKFICPCCGQEITIIITDNGLLCYRYFDNSDVTTKQLEDIGYIFGGKEEKDA